ncbi:carboxymuconolactone decarboxylase family protein [Bordetella holmesii 41130]|nr:carboxymuconolactone decarboxylase family protein [Bordetella holmesii 41130]EWM46902.1 carboxymuconolactone decarboxylase family protein [Bordetella holmesii 35009]
MLGMLTALGKGAELKMHVVGALNNGCTVEEIKEVLLQAMVYCGVPAGVEAFRATEEVLAAENLIEKKA